MGELIIPVIMCGGAGTRLWPLSRESLAKQFVPLLGAQSTFQQTLARIAVPDLFARPIVITAADSRFIVAEQARAVNAEADIVLEPMRRDSAAAVAVAAELAARRAPDAVLLVLAADHVIAPVEAFHAACRAALPAARAGRLVTFGVVPEAPATSYGYIRPGVTLEDGAARAVEAFVEKPDATTAARYVADGYLWNSGNFIFRADVMREELARFAPDIAEAVREAVSAMSVDLDFFRLAEAPFARAPKTSIDYAVMERTARAAVVPADFGWSDVGSWEAVWKISERDGARNALSGLVEVMDTENCLVRSEDSILTAVVGCRDLIVVVTADAVLVTTRDRAEQVKAVVERLRAKNVAAAVAHRRIYRPWGYYQGVDAADRYQVKRIVVKPGSMLSLQKHLHRSEHWVVVKGSAEVAVDGKVATVNENESVYIPIGGVHRLANRGKISLELIEVQVGSYLGEDDIIRLEDVYRRQ
jgi:mannose-1-phosphate guanylyltransferase/mannose-6-phosphate isomerase